MKHIKTFKDFVNENESLNESKYTYKDVKAKYLKNPYGIGANTAEVLDDDDDTIIFRFEDPRKRDNAIKELKDLGYPSNKLGKSMQDKAYEYRYVLTVSESVNEGRGPVTVKEPKAKDIQVKDKYKKGEGIFYRVIFPASTMVATSKSEVSTSVYYAHIDKVSKDGRGNPLYIVGWDKVPHDLVIGSKVNENEVNEGRAKGGPWYIKHDDLADSIQDLIGKAIELEDDLLGEIPEAAVKAYSKNVDELHKAFYKYKDTFLKLKM